MKNNFVNVEFNGKGNKMNTRFLPYVEVFGETSGIFFEESRSTYEQENTALDAAAKLGKQLKHRFSGNYHVNVIHHVERIKV